MSNASVTSSPRDPAPHLPAPSTGTAANLPRPMTTMVGRDHEIAAISAMLERDDIQLVTLTGPGGVGKTRISIDVLKGFGEGHFDAFVFVPLAAVREAGLVPPAVAPALGVPNTTDDPIMNRLSAYLQHHRTLLVLDNLEHLPDAGPFVADLIAKCASLTVLCTSRSRLNLSGEHVFPVPPLSIEASIALFAQRTTALSPGFVLTTDVSPTVEAICNQLDRLPLAIELAAARSPILSPVALLERLRHPLAMLTGGPRDAPARQRTMRNVIAWSYQLLSKDERALFRRLGVFIGGFTLEAAEAVAGDGGDVLPGLETLITSSLLNTTPGVGDTPRFTMLETIREFALEQLAATGEEVDTRQLFAEHFVRASESERRNLDGPQLRIAHDRLEADLQNCRAALAWTLETGEAELGIRLAGALWQSWPYGHGHGERPWLERISEGRSWLDQTLERRDGFPVAVLTDALMGSLALANMQGDIEKAQLFGEELLSRALAESDAYATFEASLGLASLAGKRNDHVTARAWLERAIEAAPAVRNPESRLSQALTYLGKVEERQRNTSSAMAHFEESLALGRVSANPYSISFAAANLGRLMRKRGDLHHAAVLQAEALESYLQQRDYGGVAFSLTELALTGIESRHAERALMLLAAADGLPFHPDDQPTFEQALASVRGKLDETAYDNAWNAGLQMSWETVIAEITDLTHDLETPLSHDGSGSTGKQYGLTRRKLEVMRLLTEGRSNRAIADELSLSQRTVEHHVLHILTKLGLESRTAVVAFAVRHGLFGRRCP
ncbi:MAG: LuxR C-terminal-related transcriptional regulator [Chloroflexota bacterium]|nr:LuxR C-terminal-related transcriptional regulator [Chloroflexota bacterium]